jgi:hypothetical protein
VKTLSISLLQPWNQKDLGGCLKGKWQRIICMRYTDFYGDGDIKGFSEASKEYLSWHSSAGTRVYRP